MIGAMNLMRVFVVAGLGAGWLRCLGRYDTAPWSGPLRSVQVECES